MSAEEQNIQFLKDNIYRLLELLLHQNKDVCFFHEEIPKIQFQLSIEVNQIKAEVTGLKKIDTNADVGEQVDALEIITDSYKDKLDGIKSCLKSIFNKAKSNVRDLFKEKRKFKHAYRDTLENLRCLLMHATDKEEVAELETRLFLLHKSFAIEIQFIKEIESQLRVLFQELSRRGISSIKNDGTLHDSDWYTTDDSDSEDEKTDLTDNNSDSSDSTDYTFLAIQKPTKKSKSKKQVATVSSICKCKCHPVQQYKDEDNCDASD